MGCTRRRLAHSPRNTVNALDSYLIAALDRVARTTHLLVACDYDGTLAPIVDDPNQAVPLPAAINALRRLTAVANTTTAVVSSRALRDLAVLSRLPREVHLVGSHGLEFDTTFEHKLNDDQAKRRDDLLAGIRDLTRDLLVRGVRLELKPAGVAVHTRMAAPEVGEGLERTIATFCQSRDDIFLTAGKKVIDLSVVPRQKDVAVETLRQRMSATAVVFLGDDAADEDVFEILRPPDVTIKVGRSAPTLATYQIADPSETVAVLDMLAEIRGRWIDGERYVPIERHSLLSNGRTVALVTPDAKVTWFCHPRPDSAPVFADLLGGPTAGHFSVVPLDGARLQHQSYLGASMTLRTHWNGLTVTDWLEVRPDGGSSLVRRLDGTAKTRVEFVPRPNFGQVPPRFEVRDGTLVMIAGTEPSVVWAPELVWTLDEDQGRATAELDLARYGTVVLDLRCGTDDTSSPMVSDVDERQSAAQRPWQDWAASLTLPGIATEEVRRSALTLRGLWHQPTGAFLAAATTSLPEAVRANRNWDYRYCWLRDAAMSARELVKLGSLEEAEALLAWIDRCVTRTGGHPERLHPLYTVDGADLVVEAEISTLPGYRGSRPVRVGNLAEGQIQLDVFGPVADLVAAVVEARTARPDEVRTVMYAHEWHLVQSMVEAVQISWRDPDHGIWEAPIKGRHHVHSKTMCWWTITRALDVAGLVGRDDVDVDGWTKLANEIRSDVLAQGWNEAVAAFTEAYGGQDLDAAALWVGLAGLVDDHDDRFTQTVRAIERELRLGPTVYRYKWNDGLTGTEGGFHLCTSWLIEAYLRTGRTVEATALFRQYLGLLGPTGLMPEMYDPIVGESLGNHPQAYSHLGLIRCAVLLDELAGPINLPSPSGQ